MLARNRKVLIIRPGAMGDVCMTVPFAAALARHCEVHWVLHRIYEPIPRGFHLDCRIIPVDPPRQRRPMRSLHEPCGVPKTLLRQLRDEGFHAVLDLAHWPSTARVVRELADVPVRAITFDPEQDARLGVNTHRLDLYAPFNVRVPVDPVAHQVEKWCALARAALGIDLALDWPLPAPPAATDELRVFVHPHASKLEKAWPADRFAQVLRGLAGAKPLRCLINSGSRQEMANALGLWLRLSASGIRAGIVWMDRSCRRLRAALGHVDLALGCDSGPMHYAGLVGTPTVVVYGPYEPEEFGPLWRSIPVSPTMPGSAARAVPAAAVLRAARLITGGIAAFARPTIGSAAA